MKLFPVSNPRNAKQLLSIVLTCLIATTALAACANPFSSNGASSNTSSNNGDIQKIKHIVVIMQENRSFDSYFGTYPGVDGIPTQNGVPTVCIPDPRTNQCMKPYHDSHDLNGGGPHGAVNATADIDSGKMDGFIGQAERGKRGCTDTTNPACSISTAPDVMGYHD